MNIHRYMTPNEAAYRWGINQETVMTKLNSSLHQEDIDTFIKNGLIKFFAINDGTKKEWIITEEAMERWFGELEFKIWVREGYEIKEIKSQGNLHEFEVVKGSEVVATIAPADVYDMEMIKADLDDGDDVNGWDDGKGNTINVD
ncbi:hypothetical protein BME96_09070 [Virgibacillus halodenitrificans]|uniref:Helix-turn-helix domain-containing protein n=1 Tax=Virgibacillus halodenitrificans TaxID=1482 RepID=A0AAC9NKR6_VIRHA|nr:helix-turn-helix domain-containing protein [Virgibacillus halodenitrificans]APC48308.1 hypothetical protein BME96_09070 [Virgibacillus halodenitrificans]